MQVSKYSKSTTHDTKYIKIEIMKNKKYLL